MQDTTIDLFSSFGAIGSMSTYLAVIFTFGMLVFWVGVFFILYHLIRFGVSTQPKKIAIVFIIGSVMLSLITTLFFIQAVI